MLDPGCSAPKSPFPDALRPRNPLFSSKEGNPFRMSTEASVMHVGCSRVAHPAKALHVECWMRPIAWTSPVQVQAIPLPTVDGSSQGGGAKLAKRRLGEGGLRSARVSSVHCTRATPVDWPGACGLACKLPRAALSSDAVALRWPHGESAV
ncbi:UNVERIFIED_CONTAM: hypothetical protein FKN15_017731 [Acipenser sinensis]